MSDKPKHKPAWYIVDFITALPVTQCVARLERLDALPNRGLGGSLAPVRQRTRLQANRTFTVERGLRLQPALVNCQLASPRNAPYRAAGTGYH